MCGFLLAGCIALAAMAAPILADPAGDEPTPDAEVEPVGRTVTQSSSMEAASAEEVPLGEGTWTVSRAENPSGSFLLVRNVSRPDSEEVLSVSLGSGSGQALAPRETSTWGCDALEEGTTLVVRAATGETVFAGEVDCGDAVYFRSSPAR